MSETGVVQEVLLWPEAGCPEPVRVERAEAVPGIGLKGDQKRGRTRQVTLLAEAGEPRFGASGSERQRRGPDPGWSAATAELGVDAPPSARRANVVIRGLDLADTLGKQLRVGAVLIQVRGETDPCELMNRVAPGLRDALTPERRAGVFGAVIEGGPIAVGDPVTVVPTLLQRDCLRAIGT
jgi:MOSC domain